MIETATLITLCMLYLIFFRPGKTPALENPLVIERPGQYHLTLAPQLNLAQPFIEALINLPELSDREGANSATQFFEVRDKQVVAHGYDFYLLAITLRNGIVYCQAVRPLSNEPADQLPAISEFSHAVLARFPDDEAHAAIWDEKIVAAAQHTADLRKIQLKTRHA